MSLSRIICHVPNILRILCWLDKALCRYCMIDSFAKTCSYKTSVAVFYLVPLLKIKNNNNNNEKNQFIL